MNPTQWELLIGTLKFNVDFPDSATKSPKACPDQSWVLRLGSVGDPAVLQVDLQDFSSRNPGCLVGRKRLFMTVKDGEVGSDSWKEVLSGQ